MKELKQCPFCGREAELRHNEEGFSYVVCANDGCYVRTAGDLNDDAAIRNWNKRGQWISCKERLPKENYGMFWTTHEDGSVIMHGYNKKHGFIYNWEVDDLGKRKRQGDVIAWMPIDIPKPYDG